MGMAMFEDATELTTYVEPHAILRITKVDDGIPTVRAYFKI